MRNALEFRKLKRTTNKDGYRTYEVDGNSYISVTTFLGITKSHEASRALEEWKIRLGEAEAEKETKRACDRGTSIHLCLEDYLSESRTFKEVLTDLVPYYQLSLKAMKKYVDLITDIRAQEIPLYSHTLQLAGMVDCVGSYDKKKSVIDFKTSTKPKRLEWIEDYFLQTAIYSYMIEEMFGLVHDNLVIIIAVEGESAQVFQANRAKFKKQIKQRIREYRNKI